MVPKVCVMLCVYLYVYMLQVSTEIKDWLILDDTSPVVGKWSRVFWSGYFCGSTHKALLSQESWD